MKLSAFAWCACLVLSVCTSFAAPVEAPPNPVDPTIAKELKGKWKNELGSTLNIVAIDLQTGKIEGTYISPQGGGDGTEYPLLGWVNTAAPSKDHTNHVVVISWTVRWGQIGTITGWTGYYAAVNDTPAIIGQWNLGQPNSDWSWDHILAGQDQFKKK
jgi:hypothetical protein